jgi:hypothetical protein
MTHINNFSVSVIIERVQGFKGSRGQVKDTNEHLLVLNIRNGPDSRRYLPFALNIRCLHLGCLEPLAP